jgi:PTS system mannose-specific IID component
VSGRLSRADLTRVFARLLLIQAALHRRGMQNIGAMFAIDAVARRLSDDGAALVARHTEYFNTNPNAAPVVIGSVLRIEDEGDAAAPASVARFKQSAGSALAAAGDTLFVGALKPLALTLACLSAIYSFFPGLVAVFLLYNTVVIVCRYWGVSFGYAKGWGVVDAFSSHRTQRVLGTARGLAAFAGGVLAGVVLIRARADGYAVLAGCAAVAVLAVPAMRRIPATWLAAALFPFSWVVSLIVK